MSVGPCRCRQLDNGIYEIVLLERSPAAVDVWVDYLQQVALATLPETVPLFLVDMSVGNPPLDYVFSRHQKLVEAVTMKQWIRTRSAYLYTSSLLLEISRRMVNSAPGNANRRRLRLFPQEERAAAIAWLLDPG